ncbi:hypothetical protein [Micromonospora sp. NPDC047740]
MHPLDWAEEHGLVYRVTWEDYQLAGQVAIALRGADYLRRSSRRNRR